MQLEVVGIVFLCSALCFMKEPSYKRPVPEQFFLSNLPYNLFCPEGKH